MWGFGLVFHSKVHTFNFSFVLNTALKYGFKLFCLWNVIHRGYVPLHYSSTASVFLVFDYPTLCSWSPTSTTLRLPNFFLPRFTCSHSQPHTSLQLWVCPCSTSLFNSWAQTAHLALFPIVFRKYTWLHSSWHTGPGYYIHGQFTYGKRRKCQGIWVNEGAHNWLR